MLKMNLMIEEIHVGVFVYVTCLCIISTFSSILVKPIIAILSAPPANEKELLSEIQSLQVQLRAIPMKDQFASYAKLQRRIIKLEEELKGLKNKREKNQFVFKAAIRYGLNVVIGIIMLISFLWYGKQPILTLKPNIAMLSVLNFPAGVQNGVSAHLWAIISCSTLRKVLQPLIN